MSEIQDKKPDTIDKSTSNESDGPKLREWFYYGNKPFPYSVEGNKISGYVYNHPRFKDGTYVYTSKIVYLNLEIGIAQTLNTTYVLIGKEASEPKNY